MTTSQVNIFDAFEKATKDTGAPPQFIRWGALVIVSAAIARRVYIMLWGKPVYLNLFTIFVGQSGTRKTSVIDVVKTALDDLDIPTFGESGTPQGVVDMMARSSVAEDSGREYPNLAIIASEIYNFLAEREMLQLLCDLFDARGKYTHNTKDPTRRRVIQDPYLVILGGITPDLLRMLVSPTSVGGGFTSRVSWVFCKPEDVATVHITSQTIDVYLNRRKALVKACEPLLAIRGGLAIDGNVIKKLNELSDTVPELIRVADRSLLGHISRRPVLTMKLAALIAIGSGRLRITESDFDDAYSLVLKSEEGFLEIFSTVGLSPYAPIVAEIEETIRSRGSVFVSELVTIFRRHIRNYNELLHMINLIQKAGRCIARRAYNTTLNIPDIEVIYVDTEQRSGGDGRLG